MSYIFLSFSTKNQKVVEPLEELIRKAAPGVEIYCSAEPVIKPGTDYNLDIFRHLEKADIFLALLSREYWESRYCIFELSVAFAKSKAWALDADPDNDFMIQPAFIPPLSKVEALSNTPLYNMQVTDITNVGELLLLLKQINPELTDANLNSLRGAVTEFTGRIRRDILANMSLTEGAAANAWMDERPDAPVKKDDLISVAEAGDASYLVRYDFSDLPYEPSFASLALHYMQELDLRQYLKTDRKAAFCCRIQSTGPLQSITIEFKDYFGMKLREFAQVFQGNTVNVSIPLADMNCDRLEKIAEICFVVHPQEDHVLNNSLIIDQIRVDFSGEMYFSFEP